MAPRTFTLRGRIFLYFKQRAGYTSISRAAVTWLLSKLFFRYLTHLHNRQALTKGGLHTCLNTGSPNWQSLYRYQAQDRCPLTVMLWQRSCSYTDAASQAPTTHYLGAAMCLWLSQDQRLEAEQGGLCK